MVKKVLYEVEPCTAGGRAEGQSRGAQDMKRYLHTPLHTQPGTEIAQIATHTSL